MQKLHKHWCTVRWRQYCRCKQALRMH